MKSPVWRSTIVVLASFTVQILGQTDRVSAQADKPRIFITRVPPAGNGGPEEVAPIAGKVSGVDFAAHRVVLYAHASNGVYYVQPWVAAPFTRINDDGTWSTISHLGLIYV